MGNELCRRLHPNDSRNPFSFTVAPQGVMVGEGEPRQRWIGCFRKRRTWDDLSPLFFIPLEPYPARSARHLPHAGKALSVDIVFSTYAYIRSDDMGIAVLSYNGALETISPDLFHTAFPIQPPPLRGTSFHRKEGITTRAPSLGRGCRAQRGGVGFLFLTAKPPPLCLPHYYENIS